MARFRDMFTKIAGNARRDQPQAETEKSLTKEEAKDILSNYPLPRVLFPFIQLESGWDGAFYNPDRQMVSSVDYVVRLKMKGSVKEEKVELANAFVLLISNGHIDDAVHLVADPMNGVLTPEVARRVAVAGIVLLAKHKGLEEAAEAVAAFKLTQTELFEELYRLNKAYKTKDLSYSLR